MQGDIVAQGFELMLYGMGTVLVFLTALVLATTLMSRAVTRFFPEQQALSAPRAADADARTVAVITAAVQRYRSRRE